MSAKVRAAVVGASGIGKHHAKWLAWEGAEVCAIVGSSSISAAATGEALRRTTPFSGRTYGSVARMLEAERPDLVAVASPPELHGGHARAALEAGAHVLCEKPFLWQREVPLGDLMDEAEALVALAAQGGRELVLMAQYAGLVPTLARIGSFCSGPDSGIWQFGMKMESLRGDEADEFEDTWVDLGPHPVAVLLSLLPDFRTVDESLSVDIEQHETRVAFDVEPLGSDATPRQLCHVNLIVGKSSRPERWVEVNGLRIHYAGRANADGVFRAYLSVGETVAETDDPMQLYIRWTLAKASGHPHGALLAGPAILRAQDLLFRVIRAL